MFGPGSFDMLDNVFGCGLTLAVLVCVALIAVAFALGVYLF